jgi:hypothetical protein
VQFCTFAAVFFFSFGGAATAATVPSWVQSCTSGDVNYNLCLVESEKLNYIASELSTIDASTVDLQDHSKAVWEGVWALVGLTLILIISEQWHKVWKFLS